MQSSNLLKYARYVRNVSLCKYDTNFGYTSNWSVNTNVDGWDIYNDVYFYGCWNGVLFGSSYEKECFIQRTYQFLGLSAEDYYTINIMMRISPKEGFPRPNKAKVRWITANDTLWDSNKEMEFDLIDNNDWYMYVITAGESKWYQGDITNLRVYPFIDGHRGCKFELKYVRVEALDKYVCNNTNCSHYTVYQHPCPWTGSYGSCTAGSRSETYTTVSGVSDSITVDISDYGEEEINLGNNTMLPGDDMARLLASRINEIGLGGYYYALVEHLEDGRLKIYGGDVGSTVRITGGTAVQALGFYDTVGFIGTYIDGTTPATGFDYASSRRLNSVELGSLISGGTDVAYYHNPEQFSVEAGRADFFNSLSSNKRDHSGLSEYFHYLTLAGTTIIDVTHPFNDSGKVTDIYVNCSKIREDGAKVFIVRPRKDKSFKIIHTFTLSPEDTNHIWTSNHTSHHITCDALVSKGDTLAFYNADLHAVSSHASPFSNARYFYFKGQPGEVFSPGKVVGTGVIGFSWYARSSHRQISTVLEIDFGKRVNVGSVSFTGTEVTSYFDYNIACCLDVQWEVDLHGGTHIHSLTLCSDGSGVTVVHNNIAYGIECLNDGIKSPDGGRQGDTYGVGSNGLVTVGSHAYFYVNGDGEWDYQYSCDGKHEFCYPYCGHRLSEFEKDPISFVIRFPEDVVEEVHKTAIYFKESDNFKHFSLQYYIGSERSRMTGAGIGWAYIPAYTSVGLDGATITAENADGIDGHQQFKHYLFSNPTPWISVFWDAGGGDLDSFLNYQSVCNLQWNTLTHNFEPIKCNGFKIFCDHHLSTKISEMELFVRSESRASMTDNVVLKVSDYGDRWRYVSFVVDDQDSNTVVAKVDSSPRYAILEINSQLPFKAHAFHIETSNSNLFDTCTNSLNMSGVVPDSFSDSNLIELENVYGAPCNLTVSIDKDLLEGDKTLSHIVCHSQEDLDDAIVGPGATLYKQDDFPIYLGDGNVANNCKVYGLRNLIDGKNAYYLKNNLDIWSFWGVLQHNQLINYESQVNYSDVLFAFPEATGQYFRLDLTYGMTGKYSYTVNQFYAFSDGILQEDITLYIEANPSIDNSFGYSTTIISGSVQPAVIFEETFTGTEFEDVWTYTITPSTRLFSNLIISDNKLYCDSLEKDTTIELFYELPTPGIHNFDIEFTLGALLSPTTTASFYAEFLTEDDIVQYKIKCLYNDGNYIRATYLPTETVILNYTKVSSLSTNQIKISKRLNSETFYINTSSANTIYGTHRRIKKIRFVFYNNGLIFSNKRELYISNIRITAFPELSYRTSMVLEVPGGKIDSIRFYTEEGNLTALAIYKADISGNFVLHSTNTNLSDAITICQNYTYYPTANHISQTSTSAYLVFDRNWGYRGNDSYSVTTIDRWVGYDFGDHPEIINNFSTLQVGPLYLKFQASNDNNPIWNDKFWVTLHEYTNPSDITMYFSISNSVRYRYYRTLCSHIPDNYSDTWLVYEVAMKRAFLSEYVTATLWSDPVRFYFAVDLGRRYDIDIVRHYGATATHETGIGSAYLFYSNTDTSNITNVQWDTGNTYVLLHFDEFIDGKLTESAKGYEVPVLGSFSLSNAISVFGWSGVFNGTNTVAYINDGGALVFYNFDFTMDFRVRINNLPSIGSEAIFFCKGKTATAARSFSVGIDYDGFIFIKYLFDDNTSSVYGVHQLMVNRWYHIAIVRWTIFMLLFVDGQVVYSWRKNNVVYSTTDYIHIGAQHTNTGTYGSYFNGYIDEFRVVLFSAIWRSSFTPLEVPYSDNVASHRDVRWLKFRLDCSSAVTRLAYLGVYPNTDTIYGPVGGLNCEWDYLGRDLCDYSVGEYNVIGHYATISGSSTFKNSYATNVATAYTEDMGMNNCWGFLKTDPSPSLYIELFEPRHISKIYMRHGTGNEEDGYYISAFNVLYSDTTSGTLATLLTVTGNTGYETLYEFDPTLVQVLHFNITAYVSGNLVTYDATTIPGQTIPDLTPVVADGGFINEIRLISSSADYLITSENYPRICLDLGKQYNIVSKSVWAGPSTYPLDPPPPWSADDQYFKYSPDLIDNPSLIRFIAAPTSTTFFGTAASYVSYYYNDSFVLSSSIYLPKGSYEIRWETLGVTVTTKIKLVLSSGPYIIEAFPVTVGASWTVQSTQIVVEETDFYKLEVQEHQEYDDVDWGVRNIYIYATTGVSRWVHLEMNAATEYFYGWNNGSPYNDKNRTLRKIFLFTDDRKLPPTQNSDWWISSISTLSSDYVNTLVDECSLNINYPASDEMDWVIFLEADHFNVDKYWLEQDLLCFNFYIDDINNLDLTVGGFGFGNVDGKHPFIVTLSWTSERMTSKPIGPYTLGVYGWDLSRIPLTSGWNRVRLKFVDWNATVPITIPGAGKLSTQLNLRNYLTTSFGIFYKGKGNPLNLKIENIQIERNRFDTEVMTGKGVCIGYGEYMMVQAPGLSLGQGSVELIMSMYNSSAGVDYFGSLVSRTILTMSNTNNDILSLGVTSGKWFEVSFGNALKMINNFGLMDGESVATSAYLSYGQPFHLGLSWSNDGSAFDNGDTIRVYIDGVLVARWQEHWEFNDYRVPSLILGGGTCATALGNRADGSVIFEIIKLYNYCKDDFDLGEALHEVREKKDPNDYIYISKDNINFYDRYSLDLPFNFIQVSPGEKVPIYVKTFKDTAKGSLKSVTGELVVEWEVAV